MPDKKQQEMQIQFARGDRALLLIVTNLFISALIVVQLLKDSNQIRFDLGQFGFEAASFVSVFVMFVAATLIKVSLAER